MFVYVSVAIDISNNRQNFFYKNKYLINGSENARKLRTISGFLNLLFKK